MSPASYRAAPPRVGSTNLTRLGSRPPNPAARTGSSQHARRCVPRLERHGVQNREHIGHKQPARSPKLGPERYFGEDDDEALGVADADLRYSVDNFSTS